MLKECKRKILMLKYAGEFLINLIFLYALYLITLGGINTFQELSIKSGILDTIFFLYCYYRLEKMMKKIRKTSDEGGFELKGVYIIYIGFILGTVCCTYNLDDIKLWIIKHNFYIFNDISLYGFCSSIYNAIQIIHSSIEVVLIKDVVFEINGWNINKTLYEYWDDLLNNQKIYMLHEDRNKKIPRLWLIRGDACADIVDYSEETLIYHSQNEYIRLSNEQAREILRRRKIDDNDQCSYEGDSAWILTPWKEEHYYAINLIMIDLSCYKEEVVEKIVKDNRDKILLLPSNVKSYKRKWVGKISLFKEKVEKAIVKWIK